MLCSGYMSIVDSKGKIHFENLLKKELDMLYYLVNVEDDVALNQKKHIY